MYRRGVSQQIGRAFFKVTAKVVEAVINVLNLQLGAETANQLLQKTYGAELRLILYEVRPSSAYD